MILFLAGTSDARELALQLQQQGHLILTTVVTENAALELKKNGLDVVVARLTMTDFMNVINKNNCQLVIDASHPFAEEASKNALEAAKIIGIPYIRYEREGQAFHQEGITLVDNYQEAADLAFQKKGVIMLTTGSKTLQTFTDKLLGDPTIRLIIRMLPRKENLDKAEKLGLAQKDIVAIQGPFTTEFNLALFQQFSVTTMITKESGKRGSVDEKVKAALQLGIETIMIKRPTIDYENVSTSFEEVFQHVSELYHYRKGSNT